MLNKTFILAMVLVILIPVKSIAKEKSSDYLSERHKKWLEEEVVYIITDVEKNVFSQLETDREREMFIETFWKHRDPTVGTPENEYKNEHYDRIQYANKNFGRTSPNPGWKTDRGRTYITLGEPRDVERYIGEIGIYSTEIWFYQGLAQYGLPAGFNLVFFQKDGFGDFVLYSPTSNGPHALMTNYFGDPANYLKAVMDLKKINPRLATVSMSLIDGEPATRGFPSLASDMLIQQIFTVPEKQFEDKYAEKFLLYKDIVEVDYTANYIDSNSLVRVMKEPSGLHFVHYIIEINRFSVEQYQDKYVTHLKVNGSVSNVEGETIYQFERSIPVEFEKEHLDNITYRPFAFYDLFPLIPGEFKLLILLKNEVSKEFTSLEKKISIPEKITSPQMSPLVLGYDSHHDSGEKMKPFKFMDQQIYCQPLRIFLPQDMLFVGFQVLGLNPDLAQNTVIKYEIFDGSNIVLTSINKISDYSAKMNILEQFPLKGLSPGYYHIEVRVITDGSELLSESERFEITPATGFPRPWTQTSSLFPVSHPAYSLIFGMQYFNEGKIEKAKTELERALQNAPNSQEISLRLANVYFILKDYKKSKKLLLSFAESDDVDYGVLFLLGRTCQALGEWDRAVFFFDKAINRFGINIFLLNSLGDCYFSLRMLKEAKATWEKSLEIKPDQPRIKEKVESIREKKLGAD
jgi:GWxTD domain-containing protein